MKENVNENHASSQSQASKILDHMLRGHAITGLEALELYGCFRLPARIADIVKSGFPVQSKYVTTPNGKRVKSYWI